MTMPTISLSITAIERLVFALSALRSHYNREKSTQVPLLTTDRREALVPLIKVAIGEIALKVGAMANPSEDGDIVTVAICRDGTAVRTATEHACALRVLQMANIGYDSRAAADYGQQSAAATELVLAALAGRETGGKIMPHWY